MKKGRRTRSLSPNHWTSSLFRLSTTLSKTPDLSPTSFPPLPFFPIHKSLSHLSTSPLSLMSSPSPPLLGTPYIQSQSSSSTPTLVTPSTCQNLSAFKSLLRQSRGLDDSITTRLNRANALNRNTGGGKGGGECESVWKELGERWGERNRVLSYCDQVLAGQGEERRREESGLSAEKGELGRGRSTERELKVSSFSLNSLSIFREGKIGEGSR